MTEESNDTKQPPAAGLTATTTLGPATGYRTSTGEAEPLTATAVAGEATGAKGTPPDPVWDLAVRWRRFERQWGAVLAAHRATPADPQRVADALDDLAVEIMDTAAELRRAPRVDAAPEVGP